MANRVANLGKPALPNPPALSGPTYHNLAKRLHCDQMIRAQDQPLTPGRRVILEEGWRGNPRNHACDIDVATSDIYFPAFEADEVRTVHEVEGVRITPGHVLRLEARCLPSAETYVENSENSATLTGAQGSVKLIATWNDTAAGSETVTAELEFPAAPSEFGHGLDAPGAGFAQLQDKSALCFPTAMLFDSDEVVRFCQAGVTVDLELQFIGGIRPVDVVVFEQPFKFGLDDADTPGPAHIYQNNEEIISEFIPEYPIEGLTNYRLGAQRALDVVGATQMQLGPSILSFGAHDGATRPQGGGPKPIKVTSTTMQQFDGQVSAQTHDLSGGTFGRRFAGSDPTYGTADSGVIRVLVSVYWKTNNASYACTLRAEAAAWSYVELETSSTSYGWSHAVGHLQCGQTVLDAQQLALKGKIANALGTGSIRYIAIHYLPG